MLATQVLPDDIRENQFNEEAESETIGFVVVGSKRHEIKKGENKIGRDPDVCSIVLDHITVSKVHAVIEGEGPGDAFIYDVGSTNQTKLGKKCLKPHCRYKLDDGAIFTLGDISAKFIEVSEFKVPQSLTQTPGEVWQSSVSYESEIFDLSTQVNICSLNKSKSSPEGGKLKESFCSGRSNSGPQSIWKSQNSHSRRKSKSEVVDSLEISDIFSVSTQCQVQHSPQHKSQNDSQRSKVGNDIERAKSLLDDGQDDVLCSIMVLHSPSSGPLEKEKVEVGGSTSRTSDQVDLVDKGRNIGNEHHDNTNLREENKDNTEELSDLENLTQIFKVPHVNLPPESLNLETNEDLVMTQIYPIKETTQKEQCLESSNVVKDDAETEKVLCSVEEPSMLEVDKENDETQIWRNSLSQGSENDDFVGTQMYPCEVPNEIPESENVESLTAPVEDNPGDNASDLSTFSLRASEDLVETQIFETENGKQDQSFKSQVQALDKSSGEETESDLDIFVEYDGNQQLSGKPEKSPEEIKYKPDDDDSPQKTDHDSNSSYIFEVNDEGKESTVQFGFQNEEYKKNAEISVHFVDSDETDCSEIEEIEKQSCGAEMPVRIESPVGREIQDVNNEIEKDLVTEATENKSDHSWNELSLNMPPTQEVEGALEQIFKDKELSEDRLAAKRLRDRDGLKEAIPSKKPKSFELPKIVFKKPQTNEDKQFEKLRRDHDIAQILTNRTRNSSKNVENSLSKFCLWEQSTTTSKKKNSNLWQKLQETSYTTDKQTEVETATNDNFRVLRSASRKRNDNQKSSDKPTESSSRKGKRISKKTKPNIVFTGFESEQLDRIILELGGQKTNDLYVGEVVVTDKVRRTVKFLCAVGMGLPIASPQWLLDSKNQNKFLDPWDYILKDKQSEEKWEFDLRLSLERSKRSRLLEDYSVFATENTKPPVKDLLAIVECCGGVPLFGVPRVWPRKTIVVSCEEDETFWSNVKQTRQTKVVHYEFILSGVLRQKLDFKKYKLR